MSRNSSPHLVATPGEQDSLPPSRSASPTPAGTIARDPGDASVPPNITQDEWLGRASELKPSSAHRFASAPRPSSLSQSVLADEAEDIQIGPSSIPQSPLQLEELESSQNEEDVSDEDFDIRGERKTRGQTRGRGRPRKRGASERRSTSRRRGKEKVTPTKTTNGLLAPPSSQTRSRSRSPSVASVASATSARDRSPAAEEGSIPSAHFFQSAHQSREVSRSPSIASAATPLQDDDEPQKQQQPPLKRKRGRPRKRQPEPSVIEAGAAVKQSEGSDSSSELSSPPVESERVATTKKKRRVSPSTDEGSFAVPPRAEVKELSFTQKLRKDIGLSSDSDVSEPAERATSLPVSTSRGKGKAARGGKKANASASAAAKRQSREQTRAEQEEKRQTALTTALYEQELLDKKQHPFYIQLMDTIEQEHRLRMQHAKAWLDISLKEVDVLADAQSRSVLRQWQEENRSMRSDLIEECQRIQRTVQNNYFDPYKMLCPHSNPPELSGVYLDYPGSDAAWRNEIGTEPGGLAESDIATDFAYMGFTIPDTHQGPHLGDRAVPVVPRSKSEPTAPSVALHRGANASTAPGHQPSQSEGRQLKASPPDPQRSARGTASGSPPKSAGLRNFEDLPPPVFHAKHRPQPAFAAASAEAGPSTAPKPMAAPTAGSAPKPASSTPRTSSASQPPLALKVSAAPRRPSSSKPAPSSSSQNAVVSFPPQPPVPGPSRRSDVEIRPYDPPVLIQPMSSPKTGAGSAEKAAAKREPAVNQQLPPTITASRPPRAWGSGFLQMHAEPPSTSQQQQQGGHPRQPGSSQLQQQKPQAQARQLSLPIPIGSLH